MRWTLFVLTACGRFDFGVVPDANRARFDADGRDTNSDAAPMIDGPANACSGAAPMCAPGQYCATPVGMCMGTGSCTDIPNNPTGCTDVLVCGCDGMVYGSLCAAEAAGESVASVGGACSI